MEINKSIVRKVPVLRRPLPIILLIFSLAACGVESQQSVPINTSTATSAVKVTTTFTETPKSTETIPSTPVQESTYAERKCVKKADAFSSPVPEGVLIVGNSLIALDTMEKILPKNPRSLSYFAISSDFRLLAIKESSSGKVLLLDSNGEKISEVKIPFDGDFVPRVWLDRNHLVLNNMNDRIGRTPLYVINISTSEVNVISPDFGDIREIKDGIGYFWHPFGFQSRLSPSPDLSFLVYPTIDGQFVGWDLSAEQETFRFQTYDNNTYPWWTSGGEKILTVLPTTVLENDSLENIRGTELVFITPEGEITRLTHFSENENSSIFQFYYVLSPDNSKVAFSTEDIKVGDIHNLNPIAPHELNILDLNTGVVTNYCIKITGYPIWSPDGNHLLVGGSLEENPNWADLEAYIISFHNQKAVEVPGYLAGSENGWMVKEP